MPCGRCGFGLLALGAAVCPGMRKDPVHGGDPVAGYLDGLPPEQAAELARVNEPGLTALREYLASGRGWCYTRRRVAIIPRWGGCWLA